MTQTPDLLAKLMTALEAIDERAMMTRRRLSEGQAVNGLNGFQEIHEIASDALMEVEERRDGAAA